MLVQFLICAVLFIVAAELLVNLVERWFGEMD